MRHVILYLFIISSLIVINACVRINRDWHHHLDQQFKEYIGKSSTNIQHNLDLKKMGYQSNQNVIKTPNKLTYTFRRPVRIPTFSNQRNDSRLSQHLDSNTLYHVSLQCKVSFILKHDIAQSVHYNGEACYIT